MVISPNIAEDTPPNQFQGLYLTQVGIAVGFYPLVGQYDPEGDASKGTVGW